MDRLSSLVTDNTTKEEIMALLTDRMKGKDSYSLKWFVFTNGTIGDIIVRVTIVLDEYITEILTYDTSTSEINKWDLNDGSKQRYVNVLPEQGQYYWYGGRIRIHKKTGVVEKISSKTHKWEVLSNEDWKAWLDGDNSIDVGSSPRINFLEEDIIEHLTMKRNIYYGLLSVFHSLYNMGYWTYGGLVNHVKSNITRLPNRTKVVYSYRHNDTPNRQFEISIDGVISGTDDNSKDIVSDLIELGAIKQ